MIELTWEDFLMWAISIPLVAIGLYTVIVGLGNRAKVKKAKNSVICCRVCGHLYQDPSNEKFPICSECGRANDRGRSRRLG